MTEAQQKDITTISQLMSALHEEDAQKNRERELEWYKDGDGWKAEYLKAGRYKTFSSAQPLFDPDGCDKIMGSDEETYTGNCAAHAIMAFMSPAISERLTPEMVEEVDKLTAVQRKYDDNARQEASAVREKSEFSEKFDAQAKQIAALAELVGVVGDNLAVLVQQMNQTQMTIHVSSDDIKKTFADLEDAGVDMRNVNIVLDATPSV